MSHKRYEGGIIPLAILGIAFLTLSLAGATIVASNPDARLSIESWAKAKKEKTWRDITNPKVRHAGKIAEENRVRETYNAQKDYVASIDKSKLNDAQLAELANLEGKLAGQSLLTDDDIEKLQTITTSSNESEASEEEADTTRPENVGTQAGDDFTGSESQTKTTTLNTTGYVGTGVQEGSDLQTSGGDTGGKTTLKTTGTAFGGTGNINTLNTTGTSFGGTNTTNTLNTTGTAFGGTGNINTLNTTGTSFGGTRNTADNEGIIEIERTGPATAAYTIDIPSVGAGISTPEIDMGQARVSIGGKDLNTGVDVNINVPSVGIGVSTPEYKIGPVSVSAPGLKAVYDYSIRAADKLVENINPTPKKVGKAVEYNTVAKTYAKDAGIPGSILGFDKIQTTQFVTKDSEGNVISTSIKQYVTFNDGLTIENYPAEILTNSLNWILGR